jgi:hypothetical protein
MVYAALRHLYASLTLRGNPRKLTLSESAHQYTSGRIARSTYLWVRARNRGIEDGATLI